MVYLNYNMFSLSEMAEIEKEIAIWFGLQKIKTCALGADEEQELKRLKNIENKRKNAIF